MTTGYKIYPSAFLPTSQCFLYRFASLNSNEYPIRIAKGQIADCKLLGAMELAVASTKQRGEAETLITLQPTFKTSSGLFLQGCKKGRSEPTTENRLLVKQLRNGQTVDQNSTGFS